MDVDNFHLSAADFSSGTDFSTKVFPSYETSDLVRAPGTVLGSIASCFFKLDTSCLSSATSRFNSWICCDSEDDCAQTGWVAIEIMATRLPPAARVTMFLVSICFSLVMMVWLSEGTRFQ